ncbi:unnamed protein product, partial [marine sediment metagenome]
EDISAVQYLEQELGLNVHSIQNIQTIYGFIKDSLSEEMRGLWLDYYRRYGTVKLD